MRRLIVLVALFWLTALANSYGDPPRQETLVDIPEKLAAAKSASEMDRISDAAVSQKRMFEAGLVRLLKSSTQQEQKIRACYLLGQFRTERAIDVLGDNFSVTTGVFSDTDKIPRFGPYPCLGALGDIGIPAEEKLIELLKSTEDASLRHYILGSLVSIEKRRTPALLREELRGANDKEAARLRDALREFGEKQ